MVSITDGQPVTIDRLDPVSDTWAPTVTTEVDGLGVDPDAVVWTGDRLLIAGSYEPGAVDKPETESPTPLTPSRTGAIPGTSAERDRHRG